MSNLFILKTTTTINDYLLVMPADPDLNLQSNGTANGTRASLQPTKLGFSLSSKSGKPTPSINSFPVTKQVQLTTSRTTSPGTKRPYSSLLDDDGSHTHQVEAVTTISTFGLDANDKKKEDIRPERVIQGLANKDWQEEAKRKRQKSGIPGQGQGQSGAAGTTDVVNKEAPAHGLTIAPRASDQEVNGDASEGTVEESSAPAKPPQTADDEALAALLGVNDNKNQTMIRPASPGLLNEDEAFANDFRSAPRMATLDEYTATPVEGFGAAILRGYLKPGETLESRTGLGRKDKKPEPGSKRPVNDKAAKGPLEQRRDENGAPGRRPGLLGLGAKSDAGAGIELGAWGKNAKGKGGAGGGTRTEIAYMPVAMRNKKTGAVVSEEELKKLMEEQKYVETAGEVARLSGERDSGRRKLLENGHSSRGAERDRRQDSYDEDRRRRRRKVEDVRRRDDDRDYNKSRSSRRDTSRDRESRKDTKSRRRHDDDEDYDRRERRREDSRDGDGHRSARREKDDDRHRSSREKDRYKDNSSRHEQHQSRDRDARDSYHQSSRR